MGEALSALVNSTLFHGFLCACINTWLASSQTFPLCQLSTGIDDNMVQLYTRPCYINSVQAFSSTEFKGMSNWDGRETSKKAYSGCIRLNESESVVISKNLS
ncbi:hypothetical protein NE237_016370 [Protea cynaroides]|uniref:Uncharacterized protein n=1 Tax=Protea cynaroides TaxID=273540 RepID=A0A9Q0JRX1_9MAGN|nr:hypothetical protein NE237_016370 [Protea cynaroides]